MPDYEKIVLADRRAANQQLRAEMQTAKRSRLEKRLGVPQWRDTAIELAPRLKPVM